LTDTAGRKLVLTLTQQRDDRTSLVLEVQSVQYNDGVVMTPPPNRIEYHWNTDAGGAVASLTQHLELGQGARKTEVVARYDKVKNQTSIHVALPTGPEQFTAPGLVRLQTSTISGNLGFSDGTHIWPRPAEVPIGDTGAGIAPGTRKPQSRNSGGSPRTRK
jgi:hypothetical protein